MDEALTKTIDILYKKRLLKENSEITVIKYQEDNVDYKSIFDKNLANIINYSYNEQIDSIDTIKEKYNISEEDRSRIIYKLILQSKEVARNNKNTDKTAYKDYTDNVYRQLVKYKENNNIYNEERDNHTIDITLLPADETLTISPTANSYFYIQEGMVFAYIDDEGVCQ